MRRNLAGRSIRSLSALGALALGLLLSPAARAQGTLSALQAEVDQIARHARPSVVTVFAQRTVTHRGPVPGQVVSRLHTRVGSGVAVEESGILTTASVVLGAERVLIRTSNGLQVEAQIAGLDPIFNVALLRVPDVRLPTLPFAEGSGPQIGDWVVALGTSYRAQPTQSVGNITYVHREPRLALLQLNNAVYPGNSGGAALNVRGELVGLVQGELGTPDLGGQGPDVERRPGGMSFVLPVENVRPAFEGLRREGRVRHGFLGVTTRGASVESASEAGVQIPLGALVEDVQASGPAAQVGLRRGDLIVAFDGERVEYPEQLARWVAATRPGALVSMVWVHNELQRTGRVALGESPHAVPPWAMTDPVAARTPDSGPPGSEDTRITGLEREIRRLNRELARLKTLSPH